MDFQKDKSQNYLESFFTNPGFEHLGHNILNHLNKKTILSLKLANHSCKNFVENPRFWLKKLNYKKSGSLELHEAWSKLINKVEEENPDLKKNIAFNLIRLVICQGWSLSKVTHNHWRRKIFPLNVVSLSGDLALGMVSHKMSLITIFGHKHFKQKFNKNLSFFMKKKFSSL